LIIALIARRGSFWRAAVASLVAVVFSTQVAGIVGQIIWNGPHFIGFTGYYTSSDDEQSLEITLRGSTGGGRATTAIFGGATGYRFVGAVTLGVLVGIVVGIVARRLGEGEPQERSDGASPPQAFFPPGAMQRGYEAGVAGPPNPEGGRHSRD